MSASYKIEIQHLNEQLASVKRKDETIHF